jgi:hypothetical protein
MSKNIYGDNGPPNPFAGGFSLSTLSGYSNSILLSTPVSTDDKLTSLYKKSQGYPNTSTQNPVNTEFSTSVLPIALSEQQCIDKIVDLTVEEKGDMTKIKGQAIINNNTTIVTAIPLGINNFNCTQFGSGLRCVLKSAPYMVYYKNIVLSPCVINPWKSFYFELDGKDLLLGGKKAVNILRGAIPSTYRGTGDFKIDLGYIVNNNIQLISLSDYIFDRDAGIITIYNTDINKISNTSPPIISFWRYEGRTLNDIDLDRNVFTKPPPAPCIITTIPTDSAILIKLNNPQIKLSYANIYAPDINTVTVKIQYNTTQLQRNLQILPGKKVPETLIIHKYDGVDNIDDSNMNIYLNSSITSGIFSIKIGYKNSVFMEEESYIQAAFESDQPLMNIILSQGTPSDTTMTFNINLGTYSNYHDILANNINYLPIKEYTVEYTENGTLIHKIFYTNSILLEGLVPSTEYTFNIKIKKYNNFEQLLGTIQSISTLSSTTHAIGVYGQRMAVPEDFVVKPDTAYTIDTVSDIDLIYKNGRYSIPQQLNDSERYIAVFKWQHNTPLQYNSLTFSINDISGRIYIDYKNKKIKTLQGYPIEMYYKVDNFNWVNLNSTENNNFFSTYITLENMNTTVGAYNRATFHSLNITYENNTLLLKGFTSPITHTSSSIYFMIGLLPNTDIQFRNVVCTVL